MRTLIPPTLLLTACIFGEGPPAIELELVAQQNALCTSARSCPQRLGRETLSSRYHKVRVDLRERFVGGELRTLLRFKLDRPTGERAQVSLDFATPGADPPLAAPEVSYVEWRGAEKVFEASRAGGRIELSTDPGCPCQTGRLELLLQDVGPDGVLDTPDDRFRSISNARLRRGDRPFCHKRSKLTIRPDIIVVGSRTCPVRGRGGRGSASAFGGGGYLSDWNDDGWYDEDWCGDWEGDHEADWDDHDDEWQDQGYTDDWGDDWGDDDWGDDWGDDDWGDDWGGDDWGGDDWGGDDWGDDDWGDDDWGDDWGDDDWGDDGDDWWDDDW